MVDLCLLKYMGSSLIDFHISTDKLEYKAILENITHLLPSVLLRVRSTSNNANGNKRVIFFSYGDNDYIVRTFDFIARNL